MSTLRQPGYHGRPHAAWAPGTLEWAVLTAGASLPGAAERWDARRAQGLDEAGLLDALGLEFGGVERLVWRAPSLWCVGGADPRLWLRAGAWGRPTLARADLARYARKVFAVPGRSLAQARMF